MADRYRYIGKHLPRKDAVDIVTGRAVFIDDMTLPRMLYGKALRSPYAHALITRIDVSKAKQLEGVKAVLTYETVPDWITGLPDHRLVLDRHLRAVGDGVALVAATSPEIAEEALNLIDVEYEILPPVYDMEEAIQPGAPQLYEQFPRNEFTPGCPMFSKEPFKRLVRGNIAEGFKDAEFVAEGTYGFDKFPHPLPPEPPGVIAKWENSTDLTVWASSAAPHLMKMVLQFRMRGVNIRLIGVHTGGSYGNKQIISIPTFYAAALAQATGLPVKVVYTKAEHLLNWEVRLGSRMRGKVGFTKEGIATGFEGMWLVEAGFSSELAQGQMGVGLGEAQLMLSKCQNWDLDTICIATNRSPAGPIRGFGGQELKSAMLPIVSVAMKKGNFDPVEIFKKNFVQPGDGYIWRDGNWWVCRETDYVKTMEETARKFGWSEKWKGWNKPTTVNGTKAIGVGVGVHGNADVGEDESEASCRLDAFGTATVHCCIGESGTAQRHAAFKMVAEVLQLPIEDVKIVPADTLVTPFDFGLVGSRGTITVGTACIRAAEDARRQLLEKAAAIMHIDPEALDTRDGFIFIKADPSKGMPWIAALGGPEKTITGLGSYQNAFTMPNFVIFFVETEVDLETGLVKILSIVEGTDAGQIIDPINLRMQLHGSIGAACLDTALFEESVLDKSTGRVLSSSIIDYKWRTFNEFPPFETVILESQFDTHRFKAIGVGEISGAPAAAAVLMAISNATGVDIMEYPATPAVILKALGKA